MTNHMTPEQIVRTTFNQISAMYRRDVLTTKFDDYMDKKLIILLDAINALLTEAKIRENEGLLHQGVCEYMIGWHTECEKQMDCPKIRKRIAALKKEASK